MIGVDIDSRNIIAWRIPNDPSPKQRKARNKKAIEIDDSGKKNNKSGKVPGNSTPMSDTKAGSINSSSRPLTPTITPNNMQNRVWATLFQSVTHSIDELYELCVSENNQQRCQDSIDLLERSRIDFIKLIERINDQKQFNDSNPISLSWEIRKPVMYNRPNTNYSYTNSPVVYYHQPYVPTIPADSGSVTTQSKLRASAPEFKPAKLGNSNTTSTSSSLNQVEKSNESASNPTATVTNVPKQPTPTAKASTKVLPQKNAENIVVSTDPWDADTEAEVVKASEQIWAEAEAWIEAEAEVEEAAWEVLRLGSSFEDDDTKSSSTSSPLKLPLPLKVDNILVTPATKSSISNLGSILGSMSYDDTYSNDENRSDNNISSGNGDSHR